MVIIFVFLQYWTQERIEETALFTAGRVSLFLFFFVCVCVNARVFVRAFLNKSSLGCYRSHGTSRVRNDDDPEKKHIFFIVSLTMWQVDVC